VRAERVFLSVGFDRILANDFTDVRDRLAGS
jgi:hypothetical protein